MALSAHVPELGALDLLLSVARLGSVGRAAAEHGITQPAASGRIRNMERLLGFTLLERDARGSRLTPAGTLVVDWARQVLSAATELDAGIAALRAEHMGRLRVAASMTVAEYLMPAWLVSARLIRPDFTVSLRTGNSTHVADLVREGEVDLGFVEGPQAPSGLYARVVAHDRLVVVVAPGHPWARRRNPVGAAEIASTPLIEREPGSGTRYVLHEVLRPYGPVAGPLIELSSTTAIKAAAAAGAGPAVVSSLAVADEVRAGSLVEVPVSDADLGRRLRAVWTRGRRLGPPVRDFLATIARTGPQRGPRVRDDVAG